MAVKFILQKKYKQMSGSGDVQSSVDNEICHSPDFNCKSYWLMFCCVFFSIAIIEFGLEGTKQTTAIP